MTTAQPVALVTGPSSGIGKAASLALAEAGFEVIGTSRNPSGVVRRDGVTFVDLDVAGNDSVAAVVQRVTERFGRLDVLADHRVFDINVFGVMRRTKAVLPHMRAQEGGRIINISSVLGFIPQPYMAVYAASKHAVEGYSESLDHEVREHGVRVLLVEPAYTNTSFETNMVRAETPLPTYAPQRLIFDDVMAAAIKDGDDPAVVAKAVVAAATDTKPKLRYTAGPPAGRVSMLRRIAPARVFDRQIRKLNRLAS